MPFLRRLFVDKVLMVDDMRTWEMALNFLFTSTLHFVHRTKSVILLELWCSQVVEVVCLTVSSLLFRFFFGDTYMDAEKILKMSIPLAH